ncbi:heme lyase CcmF/NrfE family subunit [Polymorphobacter fuscus]|uniref:Heme lyase CcmF/NrfE family subunit n=1 Tax=Sandarakinorhabdus fusca TaxID=1439888 RepID=A0A7C9KZ99_9SPHN|nr:heme lyase CcmF/NrfE family subunit [Polymorphobacter fuscus]KAB7646504.1 heme lyase CcmF/NrfE family subunit [Polymorphobacter fuscus]MQT17748.1 heme lyase CcmF/NrfE family subunit [Polymorphobacter fuscus]NJC09704.1 cytochrome c-type biogenesis protein CcmF [Polymorphobacter fuscus]
MIAEIGHFALILALLTAIAQAVLPMAGAVRGDTALMTFGRSASQLQAVLIVLAFAALMWSFGRADFSVALVANNSSLSQPLPYRLAATWGNHEGSMLLWVLILAVFGAGIGRFGDNLRPSLQARVLSIQAMISVAFLAFSLFTSNPFERLNPVPPDGAELNPLLQDPGLVFHPPLLYLGYVGFSVTFSFAVAALLEGRADAAWARWMRPWVLAAWVPLTCGIALGSFWAYYELGWGGWWFWDPVENASLMPWLLGTALLHSAIVTEKRQALAGWTILLAILAFSLSLIGTFLVRSGILTSVHAFAVDPERGVFILAMIIGSTGTALALFAWRAPLLKSGALFSAVSREAGLTLNNLFLMAVTAVVFLGTFYPVIMEAVSTDKISVGPPYYNLVFVPLTVPLLLLVTVGPMLAWKRDTLPALWAKLRWPVVVTLAVWGGLWATMGLKQSLAAFGLALGVWLILGGVLVLLRRWRGAAGFSWRLVRTTPAAVVGMALAHAGLGVTTAGVAMMSGYATSKILVMRPGESTMLGGTSVTLVGVSPVQGPNYQAIQARFQVDEGRGPRMLSSERRFYPISGSQTTEAGIGSSILGNAYLAIGDEQRDARGNGIVVRIYHHPLVGWIWFGGLMMAMGGAASLADRRFRIGAPLRPVPRMAPGLVPAE